MKISYFFNEISLRKKIQVDFYFKKKEAFNVFEYEITEPKKMKKKVYKTYNDIKLHLYIFEPENREPKKLLSVIVFFHGGGQKASQFFPQCEYFSKRGMMAISAEYRSWATSPVESVLPEAKEAIDKIAEFTNKLFKL